MNLYLRCLTRSILLLAVAAIAACGGGNDSVDTPTIPAIKASFPVPAKKAATVTGTSGVVIGMYQALYGMAPSSAMLLDYTAQAAADASAFAQKLANNFNNTGHAVLAKQVLDNLGVTATTVPAVNAKGESEYTMLLDAVTQIFGVFPTLRGQVILNMTNLLAGLESDVTYGTAAIAYSHVVSANLNYATSAANGSAAVVIPKYVNTQIRVTVPSNTPVADTIWLRTGIIFDVNAQDIVMNKVSSDPDVWLAMVSAPEGTTLRYSYRRNGDWGKFETPPSRNYAAALHETLVRSNGIINNTVAQWQDLALAGNATGTVDGVVTSSLGNRLMGIHVSVGPHQAITRWDGTYRIQNVPSGVNEISFQADNGEYAPVRSSLLISTAGTTTLNTSMKSALMVNVTFKVTVPSDTPSGATPRLYGDAFRLGMVPYIHYAETDPTRTIGLTNISGSTWSFTATLGVGTCVNYTYTLGYGSVNNERDASGNPVVRSLCIAGDMTTTDTVATWKAPWQVPVTFNTIAPAGSTDTLYITTDDWGNNPIKMWSTGAGTATYVLYTNQNTPIKYRFLRNGDRNLGLEIVPPADQDPPLFRNINSGIAGTAVSDQIAAWRHQPRETALTTVVSDMAQTISPRTPGSFQTGVEFWDYWRTNWRPLVNSSIGRLKSKNVQWAQIASVWEIRNMDNPTTEQGFNSFATEDLVDHIREIKSQGLRVALRGDAFPAGTIEFEIFRASHSIAWYDQFFDEVKTVLMYHAMIAQREGVDLLILASYNFVDDGGPTSSSATRLRINSRWKDIIASIRVIAPAVKLANDRYADAPEYDWYGDLDYLGGIWWEPLATADNASVSEMYATAMNILATRYRPLSERFGNKPFIFSEVRYYSANTSAMQKYPVYSREIDDFLPEIVTVPSDYDEQARAYQATLLAFANTPWVHGCYSFGYSYFDIDSKGDSIRRKTAEEIMSQIYKQLNGP